MMRLIVQLGLGFLLGLAVWSTAEAQEELSRLTTGRYGELEASSGRYGDHEVIGGRAGSAGTQRGPGRPELRYNPAAGPRNWQAAYALDAHAGVRNYTPRLQCARCHGEHAVNNKHVLRGEVQCRQCHGGEPIAAVSSAKSPLNPIRRHAYVCAKCHQGAGASFATYVIHEPAPMNAATLATFPELAWAFWIMIGIAALTFALFLPHTALWGLRELVAKAPAKEGSP
jgi:hypothetical protein